MAGVKSGMSRQEKAALTRKRMLTAAYDAFCENGFRATTMDAIAERAGVAVQTLYFSFHTKDELLQAVHDWTVLGDDPVPPPAQPWHRAAVAEPDARRSLGMFVEGLVTIEARVAPMIPVFQSVRNEPAGAVHRHSEALRRDGFDDMVAVLARKAPLRAGLTRRHAADMLFVLAGPESYRAYVLDLGWTPKQWVAMVTRTLATELFGPAPG